MTCISRQLVLIVFALTLGITQSASALATMVTDPLSVIRQHAEFNAIHLRLKKEPNLVPEAFARVSIDIRELCEKQVKETPQYFAPGYDCFLGRDTIVSTTFKYLGEDEVSSINFYALEPISLIELNQSVTSEISSQASETEQFFIGFLGFQDPIFLNKVVYARLLKYDSQSERFFLLGNGREPIWYELTEISSLVHKLGPIKQKPSGPGPVTAVAVLNPFFTEVRSQILNNQFGPPSYLSENGKLLLQARVELLNSKARENAEYIRRRATSTQPVCKFVGTGFEGWYADGVQISAMDCDQSKASCEYIGTSSEGWFASAPNVEGSTPIVLGPCSSKIE